MAYWLDVQTLIWLFPVVFMLHDFEEIIMVEAWMKRNSPRIYERLPNKTANWVMKQFSMTTAQFSVAVLIIFLFISSSTLMASQYIKEGPFGHIYFFTVMLLIFFLHTFTHIRQSILLRSVTPGVVTSIFIVLPYCILLLHSLFENHILSWEMIFISLPFIPVIIPVVLFAHWIGKRVV